mmetsp:Transcript_30844/g.59538  ORF Transcript_30844/g.59538 Transcript_30844/m.59538 type:complete len:231 (+) Transcript_30844:1627-2319(+)
MDTGSPIAGPASATSAPDALDAGSSSKGGKFARVGVEKPSRLARHCAASAPISPPPSAPLPRRWRSPTLAGEAWWNVAGGSTTSGERPAMALGLSGQGPSTARVVASRAWPKCRSVSGVCAAEANTRRLGVSGTARRTPVRLVACATHKPQPISCMRRAMASNAPASRSVSPLGQASVIGSTGESSEAVVVSPGTCAMAARRPWALSLTLSRRPGSRSRRTRAWEEAVAR